jgi:hypothetical protein
MGFRSPSLLLRILLALVALSFLLSGGATDGDQPLKATTKVITQRSCRNDDKRYTAIKKLRVTFLNRSSRNLIVDKSIGRGFYEIYVARDSKSLADGQYEYNPNIDWIPSPRSEEEVRSGSPGPPFAILRPNQSFKIETEIWVEVRMHDSEAIYGNWPIQSGDHVFQLDIGSWYYATEPDEVQKRWLKFGDLIYNPIRTEPLAFNLPVVPKLENCKH